MKAEALWLQVMSPGFLSLQWDPSPALQVLSKDRAWSFGSCKQNGKHQQNQAKEVIPSLGMTMKSTIGSKHLNNPSRCYSRSDITISLNTGAATIINIEA